MKNKENIKVPDFNTCNYARTDRYFVSVLDVNEWKIRRVEFSPIKEDNHLDIKLKIGFINDDFSESFKKWQNFNSLKEKQMKIDLLDCTGCVLQSLYFDGKDCEKAEIQFCPLDYEINEWACYEVTLKNMILKLCP
jgi:hypothetical protein